MKINSNKIIFRLFHKAQASYAEYEKYMENKMLQKG